MISKKDNTRGKHIFKFHVNAVGRICRKAFAKLLVLLVTVQKLHYLVASAALVHLLSDTTLSFHHVVENLVYFTATFQHKESGPLINWVLLVSLPHLSWMSTGWMSQSRCCVGALANRRLAALLARAAAPLFYFGKPNLWMTAGAHY